MDKYTIRAAAKLMKMFIFTSLFLFIAYEGVECLGFTVMGMLFLFGVAVMIAYTYITEEAELMRHRAKMSSKE
jgi:hypothetical protein